MSMHPVCRSTCSTRSVPDVFTICDALKQLWKCLVASPNDISFYVPIQSRLQNAEASIGQERGHGQGGGLIWRAMTRYVGSTAVTV